VLAGSLALAALTRAAAGMPPLAMPRSTPLLLEAEEAAPVERSLGHCRRSPPLSSKLKPVLCHKITLHTAHDTRHTAHCTLHQHCINTAPTLHTAQLVERYLDCCTATTAPIAPTLHQHCTNTAHRAAGGALPGLLHCNNCTNCTNTAPTLHTTQLVERYLDCCTAPIAPIAPTLHQHGTNTAPTLRTAQLVERYLDRCGRGRIEAALRHALTPQSHPALLVRLFMNVKNKRSWSIYSHYTKERYGDHVIIKCDDDVVLFLGAGWRGARALSAPSSWCSCMVLLLHMVHGRCCVLLVGRGARQAPPCAGPSQ